MFFRNHNQKTFLSLLISFSKKTKMFFFWNAQDNKIFDYLLKCPRSRLVVSLAKFLTSSHEWNYKYENHSFLTAQESWPSFSWRKQNNFKRKDFLFLQKKNYSFLCFPRKEENIFLHLCFQEEREKMYSFSL